MIIINYFILNAILSFTQAAHIEKSTAWVLDKLRGVQYTS